MKKLGLLAASAAFASLAGAQSFNIDYDASGGTFFGAPPNTFGAAGAAGWWNTISGSGVSGPLFDLVNNGTGVTLSTSNGSTFGFNAQGYTGNDELLMGDVLDMGGTGGTITFNGLSNGQYNVWVYAQAPDSPTFLTDVTILGNTQTVGGTWGFNYAVGNTHSFHGNVNVAGGTLAISIATNSGFNSVNGIQIAAVPEPGTVAAFAIGGLTLLALRRRK